MAIAELEKRTLQETNKNKAFWSTKDWSTLYSRNSEFSLPSQFESRDIRQENKGLVGKYKNFNKVTRNIGLGVGAVSVLVGFGPGVVLGFGSAAVDQGQIILIDKYQKWRDRRKHGLSRNDQKHAAWVTNRESKSGRRFAKAVRVERTPEEVILFQNKNT
ncbi:MAG: hypothetical protein A2857_04500 [Candidatus Levybacteria bacterium RIFCSPHIGHO2_01_FULL_36_15]|nr:MAG: hypothetical protein A2857_04500 [Candidatus Levybacteria bacterium RIFCSPHIGHO2_01_FULL_36_15]OGH38614.1 MAG: hypothetical protein A2905_03255 [Candidatus Levybacteria bacterium RIFCSPLOWO2_01_FULL_36_10]